MSVLLYNVNTYFTHVSIDFIAVKTTQREKAVENYNWFPAVHSFGVEKFEFSVPAKFVIMTWSVYKIFLSSNLKFQNKELSKLNLAGPQ